MRALSLRKEVLSELSTDELSVVVGGTNTKVVCLTDVCPTNPCVTPVTGLRCIVDDITRNLCA